MFYFLLQIVKALPPLTLIPCYCYAYNFMFRRYCARDWIRSQVPGNTGGLTGELFYFQCSYVNYYNVSRICLLISLNLHLFLWTSLPAYLDHFFPIQQSSLSIISVSNISIFLWQKNIYKKLIFINNNH